MLVLFNVLRKAPSIKLNIHLFTKPSTSDRNTGYEEDI
jgi:hypothetical protein